MTKNKKVVPQMSSKGFLLSLGVALGMCILSIPVQAEQVVLQVGQSIDAPESTCPKQVTLIEESKPYEGGYKVNGRADLKSLVGPFSIANRDAFSVTWAARLKPQYSQCKATAGLSGDRGSSHLRMRFIDARVLLVLDMTGLKDANGFTPAILSQSVENGNPVWQWGGTD
jgi:hypothetical protein